MLTDDALPTIFPNCPKYFTTNAVKKRKLRDITNDQCTVIDTTMDQCDNPKAYILPCPKAKVTKTAQYVNKDDGFKNDISINLSDNASLFLQLKIFFPTISLPSNAWAIQKVNDYICVSEIVANDEGNIIVRKKVVLTVDNIKIFIFDKLINDTSIIFENSTKTPSLFQFEKFLQEFNDLCVCCGGMPLNKAPNSFVSLLYQKDKNVNVWRHVTCPYLLSKTNTDTQCPLCKKFKRAIANFKYYNKKKLPRKIIPNKTSNLVRRAKRLELKNKKLLLELLNIKNRARKMDKEELHNKIKQLNMPPPQKLLLEECFNACQKNRKSSRRYTSDWLLLCLLLHIRSHASYNFLRSNDILPLPCISTIRRYLSRINLKCGLDKQFFECFKLKMKAKNKFERHGVLIFDEMQVRECISLNVKNMKLHGVQDFGENNTETSKTTDKRANHALVFMFVSLSAHFCQPVAVYASKGPTKGQCLAKLTLEIIKQLEKCGAMVDGIICDGATTNRKMWNEFGISGNIQNPINKIPHPFFEDRYLYFFSDAPHLIKCLRNRLFKKKVLKTPDGTIDWTYYQHLLNLDSKNPGNLRICPKITDMHINPSHMHKMRVKLATQIFSNSVSDGLKYYKEKSDIFIACDTTIKFTKQINDLFDALNRRYPAQAIRLNSKDFEVLKSNLEYLDNWEKMVLNGKIDKESFLTKSTVEGFRVTILSTIELAQHLLDSDFKYVLSNKFNQDPLEVPCVACL